MILVEPLKLCGALRQASKDGKQDMVKAFKLFDEDSTGRVSFKNVKAVAKELGENMSDPELQEMITQADTDNDGEVNEEEFLRMMKKVGLYM